MYANKISELVKVLPPPDAPLDQDEHWLERNQGILRIQFPTDFVDFGRLYGSGEIRSAYSWEVWSPFRATYPLIVIEFARIWNIYKDAMQVSDVPFGIFPAVGGLLPFASTTGGDWVCWITDGKPDEWCVVDMDSYDQEGYEILEMGFSEYFYRVLTRDIVLERHQGGEAWDPSTDLKFDPVVYKDQNYRSG